MVTALLTLAAALAPGAYVRWRDRAIERHADDPALPELLLARRQRTALALLAALLVAAVAGGAHALWGVPLAIVGVLAATHRRQRVLHGETWGLGAYLRYHVAAFVGAYGFWLLLGLAPPIVAAVAQRRLDVALVAAAALALVLLAWERAFARLWLLAHRASPLGAETLGASLHRRLQAILARSRAASPELHRFGAPGMRLVAAFALPSRRPRIACSDTLLEVLDEEETAAVFAHEVAHVEQWSPARLRQARLAVLLLVLLVCGTYPLLLVVAPQVAAAAPALLPVVVVVGLALRAARQQGHETESDRRAAELCGSAAAVARALVKLHLHARIPRRWPHDVERTASHPSLQRRLQALAALDAGGAPEAADAEPPTVVRSAEAGRWVALDAARVHWFDGVEALGADAAPSLAELRDRAAASRTLAYPQLAELRVAAAGETRALVAATTAGETWKVPLAAVDVAALQRRLDRVDHLLGRRAAGSRRLDRVVPRLVAAILALSIVLLPAPSAALLVFLAALAWPGASTFAAAGVTALASAAVAADELDDVRAGDPEAMLLLFLVLGGLGALLLAARWWRARRAGAGALTPERPVAALALALAVALAAYGWTRSPAEGPRHLLVLLAGAGAALAVAEDARRRRAGLALAGLAAAVLAGAELARAAGGAPRLTWREGTLVPAFEVPLRATGQLLLSPHARAFVVREYGDEDDDAEARARDVRHVVGRFGGAPRETRALVARFLDDDRLLVLRATGDSLQLAVEPVSAADGARHGWRVTLPGMLAPRLLLDRGSGRWRVAGYDEGRGITHAGVVGAAAVTTERAARELPGIPVYTARDGATYVASAPAPGVFSSLRAATGRVGWELTRLSGGERRLLARVNGYPACEGLEDGLSVVCATMSPGRSSIWRFGPGPAPARPLATLPRGAYLQRVSDAGTVAALGYASGEVYLADVATRRGLRLRLPRAAGDSPMEVQAADGWLGVLRYGRGGVRLVLYRVGS